jgi:ribosomal protein S18 acetylase RimI-like enzyme
MSEPVEYHLNKASAVELAEHLLRCDADFVPPLSSRVNINDYAQKIANKAARFEAWSGSTLVGLVAAYCNDRGNRISYITSGSVLRGWTGKGIARDLTKQCIEHAQTLGMRQISLEVASDNAPAIKLYEKSGFVPSKTNPPFVTMDLLLKNGEEHERQT